MLTVNHLKNLSILIMKLQFGPQSILVFGSILVFVSVKGNELGDFLTKAMKKYPTWLNDNKLDPYFAKDYNVTVDYDDGDTKVKMAMWDISVEYHSNLNTDLTTVLINEKGEIELNYKIQSPMEFSGTYWVKGNFGWEDYNGEGGYWVRSIFTELYDASLSYYLTIGNLQTSPECIIDMANATFSSKVDIYERNKFEGLSEGMYEQHFEALLGRITVDRLDENRFAPLQQLIDMYFTSLFKDTPFCDLTNK